MSEEDGSVASFVTYTPEEVEQTRQESIADIDEDRRDPELHKPGTFSYHEALDRTSIYMDLCAHHMDHPAILYDEAAYKLAHEAQLALFNLYQYLGCRHL